MIIGREADGLHFGQARQLVFDGVDAYGLLVGGNLSFRLVLILKDAEHADAEVILFKLSCGGAEMGAVLGDDEVVYHEPAQSGDEGDFSEYPPVLLAVLPQSFQYESHLF